MMEHAVASCSLASWICYYLIRDINWIFFSEIFPEAEPAPHLRTSQLKKCDVLTSWPHSAHLWQQPLCLLLFQHHITMNKHAADVLDRRDSRRLMKPAVVTVVNRLLCTGANWRTHVSAFAEWRISAAVSLELRGLLFVLESLIAFGIILQPQVWAFACYSLASHSVKATK